MRNIHYLMLAMAVTTAAIANSNPEVNLDKSTSKSSQSLEKDNMVTWTGYIESNGRHTTKHDHSLEFVRKADGKTFDVVESPDLEKVHCERSKKLLVEINAERTPRILFWGNNLIVKNFKVLAELTELPHKKHIPRSEFMGRDRL